MTVISTSGAAASTAYGNQRKIDRCQNDVMWAFRENGANAAIASTYYSIDEGATWTYAGNVDNGSGQTTRNYQTNFSIFIDLDDYAHVVFKDNSNGYIYYRRGTPNAARTAWTWSAATSLWSATTGNHPDVVAHRQGTGWRAHVVFYNSNGHTNYARISVTSTGGISIEAAASTINAAAHSTTISSYPSIDFNHTGDGKTVAGGTPHLYVAWSTGATGAGKGIRFRKAVYSAGSWTWNAEREIDTARYVQHESFLTCMFDGTRVVMVGFVYDGALDTLIIHDRDAADSETALRTPLLNVGIADRLAYGSATYDGSGDIYAFGAEQGQTTGNEDTSYRKWTRSTNNIGPKVIIDATTEVPYVSAKRGYSNGKIEWVYTDGSASPYSVTYGSLSLNATPNVPTNLQVTSDTLDTTPVFSADVSDPDSTQSIKARFTIYQSDGTTVVGTVDSTFTAGAHTAVKEYASALPVGNYKVAAATVDDANAISSQTAQLDFAIKQAVETDEQFIWDVDALIAVDLQASWNVLVSNQKDLTLSWNVTEQAEVSLGLEWSIYPAWIEVDPDPESPVIWEEVRA